MSQQVEIYDVTLRDGAQGPRVKFSSEDQLRIVRELDDFGVLNWCTELLGAEGLVLDSEERERLERYAALLREWNRVVSLVSVGDLDHLWERHIADSLSLVPWVRRVAGWEGRLLDLGSGGGLPVVPVKVLLPGLWVTCVERSDRKVGFLLKALAALGLERVEVVTGEFPRAGGDAQAEAVTARAVEKPERLAKGLLPVLESGAVLLCQSERLLEALGERVTVEPVEDAWDAAGLRRGRLAVIRGR